MTQPLDSNLAQLLCQMLARWDAAMQQVGLRFLDIPLAELVTTGACHRTSRGPSVLEALDVMVHYRGRALVRQLFLAGPLALLEDLNEWQSESVKERRARI